MHTWMPPAVNACALPCVPPSASGEFVGGSSHTVSEDGWFGVLVMLAFWLELQIAPPPLIASVSLVGVPLLSGQIMAILVRSCQAEWALQALVLATVPVVVLICRDRRANTVTNVMQFD